MLLKKNIWLLFNILLLLGLIYFISSIYSTWNSTIDKTSEELSYLNKIFSSSVNSSFDQQEIMLEFMGQQLLKNDEYANIEQSSKLFDQLLSQNKSLIGFGLSDIEGKLLTSSSNINLAKMPNLKTSDNSRESFIRALDSHKMVLGKTYFLKPLDNWIIPLRKAIRNLDNQLTGVMIAGIKPNDLLPRLNELSPGQNMLHFQALLIHDKSYHYAYFSGIPDTDLIKDIINKPISETSIQLHEQAVQSQLGLSISDIKKSLKSAEYFAAGRDGEINLYSTSYLPSYHLWSLTFIPRKQLIDQLITSTIQHILTFFFTFTIIYFLFRFIHNFEQVTRQQLLNQANHDFLTGLNNRLYLNYAEPKWINEKQKPFSVIFMDLDNFKNINDSYGHSFGDLILKQVALRLLSIFSDKNLVCRQGGDEFIILCKKIDENSLQKVADKVLKAISKPYIIDNYQFSIGASIGICRYPQDGKSFDDLFSAADTAMYEAKNKKLNYYIFTDELRQQILHTSKIEQALHSALRNNEFHMEYQPQIASRGALYGVEALVRWNNPKLGSIPPAKFISVAEDSGLILELGHFIIDQSIKDITRLGRDNDYYDLQLSINISVRQFLEHGFLTHLISSLSNHKFPSKQLTLEITESIFIEDFDYMLPLFNKIRALGIKISLDDFGTGFSSLSMLRKLPIDELKIDKSFIDHIADSTQDKAMVINILNIARNLGLKVVAEGIEQQQQVDLLTAIDCDIQQGYFHSKPMKFSKLEAYCSSYIKMTKGSKNG